MPEMIERWKTYWQISQAGEIIRRYFAMNFFDGILTALGIVLGFFITMLNGEFASRSDIIFISLATAIAIGVSGLTGSHLAESAERRIKVLQMKKVLGLSEESENGNGNVPKWSEQDLRRALGEFESGVSKPARKTALASIKLGLPPEHLAAIEASNKKTKKDSPKEKIKQKGFKFETSEPNKKNNKKTEKKEDKEQTLYEEAQNFASRIAAVIDGLSPFVGVVVVIIPFFTPIGDNASFGLFYASFILTAVVLFCLGAYLAKISKDSIIRYGTQMVLAALITSGLTLFLNSLR